MIQMTCLTKLQVKIKGENPVISRYISILAISLKRGCCQTENGTLVTGQTFHFLFCLAPDLLTTTLDLIGLWFFLNHCLFKTNSSTRRKPQESEVHFY